MYLREEPKRVQVTAALDEALDLIAAAKVEAATVEADAVVFGDAPVA
jgi:hypothetical protein